MRRRKASIAKSAANGKPFDADSFAVHRDGDLCGIGLTRKQAETYVAEMSVAYPESNFSTVPGGVVKPGNKGEIN